MLQEQLVDRHLIDGFLRDVGQAGKEPVLIGLCVQIIAEITEIHFERWIGDDVVEVFQCLAVFMVSTNC